jgi:O-antigen/teichoic acid export membrane protein
MFPFIVYHVGVEDYGIYLLVGAFVGYFGLLDFGVGGAIVKYIAEYNAKKDEEMVNRVVNTTFLFYLGIGTVICVALIIIGIFFIDIFQISAAQENKAKTIAFLTAIGALSSWSLRSFSSILPGMQRYDISALLTFIMNNINAGITIYLLLNGYGIVDIIFWGIVVGSVIQIPSVMAAKRLLPYLELRKKYMAMATMKKIFTFSSVLFIGQIIGLIIIGTDRIVLGAFVSIGAITFYAVARKLHDVIVAVDGLLKSALLPAATELNSLGEEKELERLVFRGGKYSSAAILSITIPIFIMATPIISVWMGKEYLEMAFITQVYISYWIFVAYSGIIGVVILAKERYKPVLWFNGVNAILNLILSIILVQYYGILGVVMGTTIPYFITTPFLTYYIFTRILDISLTKYLKSVVLNTYPQALVVAFYLFAFLYFIPNPPIVVLALVLLSSLALYLYLFYYFGLDKAEKEDVVNIIRSIISPKNKAQPSK